MINFTTLGMNFRLCRLTVDSGDKVEFDTFDFIDGWQSRTCRIRLCRYCVLGIRVDPLRFLARCRKRRLNQVCLTYTLACFLLCCCLLGPLLSIVSFRWLFCLLVVLVKLSILAKCLARKTPLRKPNHGKMIVSTKPQAEDCFWFSWFIVLFYCLCSSCPHVLHNIFHTPIARYRLFVLKVPIPAD